MSYGLGVDLGTTYTAAAIAGGDGVRIVQLRHDRYAVPSVVAPAREGARTAIGRDAQRIAALDPSRAAREFKRRFGDEVPMLVNGEPWMAEQLTAALLKQVHDRVVQELGSPPDQLVLTHPATWGEHRLRLLRDVVAAVVELPLTLVAEPVAAAIHFHDRCNAEERVITPGSRIAIYDLGGGTFDTAVLELTDDGYRILGEPEGLPRLGGLDFDEAIFDLVHERASELIDSVDRTSTSDRAALIRLREECALAKETLSIAERVEIPVALTTGSQLVVVERSDFEAKIEGMVDQTIDLMERSITSAGEGDFESVLLVGGSSRVPMIRRRLTDRLGLNVRLDSHPKQAIALGAALWTTPIDYRAPSTPEVEPEPEPFESPLLAQGGNTGEPTLPVEFTIDTSHLRSVREQRYLVALTGSEAGSSYLLTSEWSTIGRSTDSDFTLGDPAVSGTHAEMRSVDGVLQFRDLGSTNGSWHDGQRVVNDQARSSIGAELRAGSIIELGTTLVLVEAPMKSVRNPIQLASSWKVPEPVGTTRSRRGRFSKKPDSAFADALEAQRGALEAVIADTRTARRLNTPSGPRLRAFAARAPERAHEEFPSSPNYGSITIGYGPWPSLIRFRPAAKLRAAERAALNEFADAYRTDPWMPISVPIIGNEIALSMESPPARQLVRAVIHDFALRHPQETLVVLGIDLAMGEWQSVAELGVTQGVEGAAQQEGVLISLGHSRVTQGLLSDHGKELGTRGTLRLLPRGYRLEQRDLAFVAGEGEVLSGRIEGIPTQFVPVGLA